MVISRDRKKILLVKKAKSTPVIKEINWNFLVIFLSTIMVVIGIPSMVSACFSKSFMDTWGVTIFVISASVIVFLLSILYMVWISWRFQVSISGSRVILFTVLMAFGFSFVPWIIYGILTDNIDFANILLIIMLLLFLIGVLLYFLPKEGFRFKKVFH